MRFWWLQRAIVHGRCPCVFNKERKYSQFCFFVYIVFIQRKREGCQETSLQNEGTMAKEMKLHVYFDFLHYPKNMT